MTREEAISILIREKDEDPFVRTEYREQIHEALDMAIKALEKEPILDKIRAEINQFPTYYQEVCRPNSVVFRDMVEFDKVLQIIDKYMAESEE